METSPLPGQNVAIWAESLYLLNLLLLPGLAFAALIWLWVRYHAGGQALARCHVWQTLSASIWAGLLLVMINGLIMLAGGYQSPWTWVIAGLYFTTCHSVLVLLGIAGLARALAGRGFHYPLIGTQKCELC